jgi:hypothetical protein
MSIFKLNTLTRRKANTKVWIGGAALLVEF